MPRKKKSRSCEIGGQAVLEGVMMKNKDDYAVAIRRADGDIAVEVDYYKGVLGISKIKKIPFIRGIFNFIDSLVLGMRTLNYSADFYFDEEEEEPTGFDKALDKLFGEKAESVVMGITTVIAIAIALGLFILLPFYLSDWLRARIDNISLVLLLEGLFRIAIFLIYVVAISLMKDIRRLYAYHGAEHKCINCVEKGRPLTIEAAMASSRLHRRCGTSFIFFVIIISIVVFFFIRVDNIWLRAGLRVALVPLIAGISYEIIRWAGRSDNILVKILSAPGMLLQLLTTREPDAKMVEVAIHAIEAVFDWKTYVNEISGTIEPRGSEAVASGD
ncbi:MAG: DUF1385 domain-containing protein [Lachnospiraceae bacterium]|nr:DUF1385 domain-containing protein [Lachnospiraceae bacterium]